MNETMMYTEARFDGTVVDTAYAFDSDLFEFDSTAVRSVHRMDGLKIAAFTSVGLWAAIAYGIWAALHALS